MVRRHREAVSELIRFRLMGRVGGRSVFLAQLGDKCASVGNRVRRITHDEAVDAAVFGSYIA